MKILLFLSLLSQSILASPLVDWFGDQDAKVPDFTHPLSREEAAKARTGIWSAYEKHARKEGWDKEFPLKDGGIEAWVKERQIQPLVADLGEKKMPYIIIKKGEKPKDGWPLFFALHGGGGTAFRLGSLMADRWAGSCAMAAAEPLKNAPPENLRHVAFRCGIGEKDTMFDRIGLARTYFKKIEEIKKKAGGDYENFFDEQAGKGHGIDYKPGPTWIAKFERNPIPKRIDWAVIRQHDRSREQPVIDRESLFL